MNVPQDWTPARWFAEAARCYVEGHQACPWCGGSHRVFKLERPGRLVYQCNCCEFFVSHEPETDRYHVEPGQTEPATARASAAGCS